MTDLSFKEIEKIIKKYQEKLPVNVLAIAKEMGVKVFSADNWDNNLSGMIKQTDEGYSIYVNGKHVEPRQRFTIAHELAHFVLHAPSIGDGIVDDAMYRSGLSNFIESEANSYAADMLMPRDKIKERWNDPSSTIKSMACEFGTSEQAMAIRLGVPN